MFGFYEKIKNYLFKASDNLMFRIDTTQFIFDKPKFDYQPLPWIGIDNAQIRGRATVDRWNVMQNYFSSDHKSMKDIGCCVGYFCISASKQFGIKAFGFDSNQRFLRLGRYAARNAKVDCNFIDLLVDTVNIDLLPKTDVSLLLSVWHHWVFHYGLEQATEMLQKLWALTNYELYFESGEEETKTEFKLPFPDGKPASEWLASYLETNLSNAIVKKIGAFEAGDYQHYGVKKHKRSLFLITRI